MSSPPPPPPTTDHDARAEPDKSSGGYMSNMYDSVSSTAQAAYNQMPSLDPLRALIPGHQDSAKDEAVAVAEESEDGTEKKGDQASVHSVQPPVYSQASSDDSIKNDRPSTHERSTSSFPFVPHQSAAHSAAASSITRNNSTQGIHCTSPDSPEPPPASAKPAAPTSAKSAESGQVTPSASEQIKANALQTNTASTAAPLPPINSNPSAGSKESVTANQPIIRTVADIEHREGDSDDNDSDGEGEMGKRDKFKKRFGDLTDKVKAKLHK